MSAASFRLLSSAGFLLGVAAASLIAFSVGGTWWLRLPATVGPILGVVSLVAHGWAIRKARLGVEIGAFVAAALAFAPFATALPAPLDWTLAAVAAIGFLLAVEAAAASRRLAKLEDAEGREARVERIAPALRNAILVPLAVVGVLLLLARPLGRAALGLPGAALRDSIEASGIYGITLGALLLAAVLGLAAFVRHAREDRA